MRLHRLWILVLLFAPLYPAHGTGDLFYFEASAGDTFFYLMLVGREDPGVVQVSWTDRPENLPSRRYHVEMNRSKKQLYVRPQQRDGQEWFELEVTGNEGELLFRKKRLHGRADWTIQ